MDYLRATVDSNYVDSFDVLNDWNDIDCVNAVDHFSNANNSATESEYELPALEDENAFLDISALPPPHLSILAKRKDGGLDISTYLREMRYHYNLSQLRTGTVLDLPVELLIQTATYLDADSLRAFKHSNRLFDRVLSGRTLLEVAKRMCVHWQHDLECALASLRRAQGPTGSLASTSQIEDPVAALMSLSEPPYQPAERRTLLNRILRSRRTLSWRPSEMHSREIHPTLSVIYQNMVNNLINFDPFKSIPPPQGQRAFRPRSFPVFKHATCAESVKKVTDLAAAEVARASSASDAARQCGLAEEHATLMLKQARLIGEMVRAVEDTTENLKDRDGKAGPSDTWMNEGDPSSVSRGVSDWLWHAPTVRVRVQVPGTLDTERPDGADSDGETINVEHLMESRFDWDDDEDTWDSVEYLG